MIESGVEFFEVHAVERLQLPGVTQDRIASATSKLVSQGKVIMNVNTTPPSFDGLAYCSNVSITWQADTESPLRKTYLYQLGQNYYNAANYEDALTIFGKIEGYADVESWMNKCNEGIDRLKKIRAENRAENNAYYNAVGHIDANRGIRIFFECLLGFIGFLMIIMVSSSGNVEGNLGVLIAGWVILGIVGILCIRGLILRNKKEKAEEEYYRKKANKQ